MEDLAAVPWTAYDADIWAGGEPIGSMATAALAEEEAGPAAAAPAAWR